MDSITSLVNAQIAFFHTGQTKLAAADMMPGNDLRQINEL